VPGGLRWRLAGWFTLVTVLSTAIVFVAVYRGTGEQLRHQIDQELAGDASELAHNVALTKRHTPRALARAASTYVRDQPFKASSTLLFVRVPGARTSTNRPELFPKARPDEGESQAEQDEENRMSERLLKAGAGYSTLAIADVGDLRLLTRVVHIEHGPAVTVGVGEPLEPVSHAQAGVAHAFILAALLALAGALLASYLVGTRVSRPLRRMAAVAARVSAGDLYPRIHDPGGEAEEVRVLAEAFNHMLDRLTDAFAGQRAFVADASHELRTPLTVIRGQLEVLAAQADPPAPEVRRVERAVQAEITRITRLVDDLLLLAKSEQEEFLRVEPIDLPSFVDELWEAMGPVPGRRLQLSAIPGGTLQSDPDRLAQALRNLIGNAVEHTMAPSGLVRMQVQALDGGRIRFRVDDDGPGIPADQRERVFDRFHRTDSARDRASGGTGLGLAIVRAIADAHGGRVSAGSSAEGGASIELELPGFTADSGTVPALPEPPEPGAPGAHS
jgi:two-component system OmpR family sensor kinase